MLEKIDLNKKLDKESYKDQLKILQKKLASLQQNIKELEIPVIIYMEGLSASGKGTLTSKILYPLDPRQFNVYTSSKVTEEMYMRPFLWSYFINTPLKGQITIFDKGWLCGMYPETSPKFNLSIEEKKDYFYHTNIFEKQLTDDGNVIIKFFLFISQEEQKKRLKDLESNENTRWRVNDDDKNQNINYDKCVVAFDKIISKTSIDGCKWNVIEANDKYFAAIKIYKIIVSRLEEEIEKRQTKKNIEEFNPPFTEYSGVSILSSIDMNKTISDKDYKVKLKQLQNKLSLLGFKLYSQRKSVVIVYEGWDAAGKGGNIKRMTEELDPRGYEVVPISMPTKEELDHHYLWRFYKKLPKDGHLAIFDRSWYGRVLVERIENYCKTNEWQRAYKEINDLELHLSNHGTIIFKFWLSISKDEQLSRFKAREENPLKQYKITDEDWRNREKWEMYEKAINEMLFKTNTEYAPWSIIESNDKKYSRIKTLEIVTSQLEKIL